MEFRDQLNRKIVLPQTPLRIITLVPSQTELLVDLNLEANIVGITKFCVHPPNLISEKTLVGGTKKVNYNKIERLRPDIIICNKEENTEKMVSKLEEIAPVWVSDVVTLADSFEMIKALGAIFERVEKSAQIISEIESAAKDFHEFMQGKKVKKVWYVIWKNPYMVAGEKTFINSLLKRNRFENIASDKTSRYPAIGEEEFNNADLILLSTEPFPFKNADITFFEKKFGKEVKLVNGEYFSWYGSRLRSAFEYFKTLH